MNGKRVSDDKQQDVPLPVWMKSLPEALQANPGVQTMAVKAASMGCILFKVPSDPNVSSGRVLQHCLSVIENVFRKNEPCTFKFGYTHNPYFRWSCPLYGYCHAKEKWSHMVVLWVSDEPYGPSMLEASLIEMFRGS